MVCGVLQRKFRRVKMMDDDEEEEEKEREVDRAVGGPRQRNSALEEVFGHSDDEEAEEEAVTETGLATGSVTSHTEVHLYMHKHVCMYIY